MKYCTVNASHTLPASSRRLCFTANSECTFEWRISTVESKVLARARVAASSATPIMQITLTRDLETELTYLLLPTCREVRNLGQISAAAAQRGSQDSTSQPVSRQILYQDTREGALASHSQASGVRSRHGKWKSMLTHPYACPPRRCLGSGGILTRERTSIAVPE